MTQPNLQVDGDSRAATESMVRFLAKVDRDGPIPEGRPELGPCWLWTGGLHYKGYGKFSVAGRYWPAHRWYWVQSSGPIADGLELDHLCRNRRCVNPAHLEPVTHAENSRRGMGWAGANATKTHCAHGHEFDEANTTIRRGRRSCRACESRRSHSRHVADAEKLAVSRAIRNLAHFNTVADRHGVDAIVDAIAASPGNATAILRRAQDVIEEALDQSHFGVVQ